MTNIQSTGRPDHVWPEVWTNIGKAAQNREKQEWAKEKPQLDNARRLREIYFIDPDDQNYKVTAKVRPSTMTMLGDWEESRSEPFVNFVPSRWARFDQVGVCWSECVQSVRGIVLCCDTD